MGCDRMIETTPVHILLVEDQPDDREFLRKLLAWKAGQTEHVLHVASRFAEVQTRLMSVRVDLVLLNLDLADSCGLDTLQRLRAEAPSIPVVVLAGEADQELALQAMRSGAQDYVLKDRLNPEALARIVRSTIERHRRADLERELHDAEAVQSRLFPAVPPVVAGIDISGATQSAGIGCGDYFDYLRLPTGEIGLVIGDVSGHGMAAALRMVEVRAYLRSLVQKDADLARILNELNRYLLHESANTETGCNQFITFFFAALNPETCQLRYASAGHAGYLLLANGNSMKLGSTGLPLGIAELEIEEATPIQLSSGDVLFIPTDGIEESLGLFGEQFGKKRMLELVDSVRTDPAAEVLKQLFSFVGAFAGSKHQRDDITAVVARIRSVVTGPNASPSSPQQSLDTVTTSETNVGEIENAVPSLLPTSA